ncbi:uncharacterized protein [Diabrotica undecimpunctata]|uniref:uncharacterized protein n=1 Tax=Diabrotica undecimpunctata TaxID=50387 RepID=UPI003B639340
MAETLSDVDSFSDFHEEEEEYKPSESDSEATDNDNDHVTSETPSNTRKRKSSPKLSKKFVRKQKVMKAEQHVSDKVKTVRPKVCKPGNCCRTSNEVGLLNEINERMQCKGNKSKTFCVWTQFFKL